MPRRRAARAVLSRGTQRAPLGGATYNRDAKAPKWLDLPMHVGRRVRAAGSQPMRPPERQLRELAIARRAPELLWPGAITPPVFVKEGLAPHSRMPMITPLLRAVTLPHGPTHGLLPGMGRGNARRVGQTSRDSRMTQRDTVIDWTGANLPGVVLAVGHAVDAELRSAAWNRGDTRAVSLTPKVCDLIPRFSTVSFEPQEAPFGYSIFKIQSGMPALPVSQAPTPKAGQQQQRTAAKPSRTGEDGGHPSGRPLRRRPGELGWRRERLESRCGGRTPRRSGAVRPVARHDRLRSRVSGPHRSEEPELGIPRRRRTELPSGDDRRYAAGPHFHAVFGDRGCAGIERHDAGPSGGQPQGGGHHPHASPGTILRFR